VLDRASGAAKANFTQSTFFGVPLSPTVLRKRSADYSPVLNEDGRIAHRVLESMNHGQSLGEIARQLSAEFPARFAREEDALTTVVELSRPYT
jgi:hypothetical protein